MAASVTLSRRIESCRINHMENVNEIIDRQRRFAEMASDADSLYSIVDLHMLVEQCRGFARAKILAYHEETNQMGAAATDELVLHAAAVLKVSPSNATQLVQDYPDLVRRKHLGMLPLHVVVAATGVSHFGRVKAYLGAFPEGAKVLDKRGLLPLQLAILHGAEWEVVKLLIDSFPLVLQYPLLPFAPVQENIRSMIGLQPFHMACSLKYELSFLVQILAKSQDTIVLNCGASKKESSFI